MGQLIGEWITISQDSGTGNAALMATITEVNKGRSSRQVVVEGETTHGATATATVTQSGAEEYVSIDNASYSMLNAASTVTITGKSNSRKLTFAIAASSGEVDFLNIPSSFTATKGSSSQSVVLSPTVAELNPDYGNTGEYSFSITLPIKTESDIQRTCRLVVTTYGGVTASATITQAGAASSILFDGEANKSYSGDKSFTMNIGVTPSGEGWSLSFGS